MNFIVRHHSSGSTVRSNPSGVSTAALLTKISTAWRHRRRVVVLWGASYDGNYCILDLSSQNLPRGLRGRIDRWPSPSSVLSICLSRVVVAYDEPCYSRECSPRDALAGGFAARASPGRASTFGNRRWLCCVRRCPYSAASYQSGGCGTLTSVDQCAPPAALLA
jgi:hypothetical protein